MHESVKVYVPFKVLHPFLAPLLLLRLLCFLKPQPNMALDIDKAWDFFPLSIIKFVSSMLTAVVSNGATNGKNMANMKCTLNDEKSHNNSF